MSSNDRLHADEIVADEELVRSLLREQFPQWADLQLSEYRSAGTDNALFRLGSDRVVRVPRTATSAVQLQKQFEWLPCLAPHLPLAVSMPLDLGQPSSLFPWHWSVFRWLEGEPASMASLASMKSAAAQLAGFIKALQELSTEGAPLPGAHNAGRGEPLQERDASTRAAIESLRSSLDADAMHSIWAEALAAPIWQGAPLWLHGDLLPSNILIDKGAPSAVIDFGLMTAGDPACDLMAAWTLFNRHARTEFREIVAANDATWSRARGWALSFATIALLYYRPKKHPLADIAALTIDEVSID
jgi:aminoglycoside phosphotransferase (APT) family kinase protein